MKKIKMFLAILCVIAMMPVASVSAETSYKYTEEEVKEEVEAVVDTIVNMSDIELQYYIDNAMTWTGEASKEMLSYRENDTLGAYKGSDDITLKEDGEKLILTQRIHYEKCDLEATVTMGYIIDTVKVIDLDFKTIDTSNASLGEKMANAAFNTVIGIVSVFLVLLLISFIISLFKYIPRIQEAFSRKKTDSAEEVLEQAIAQIEEKQESCDDTELVAVITAAICASTGASSDSFVVRSIKRVDGRRRR